MAAALARHADPAALYVASAGVFPGERDPFVDTVMAEVGLSLGDHRPQALEDLGDLNFDLAITLSPQAHHRMMELTRTQAIGVEYWPTPDPTLAVGTRDQMLAAYRDLRQLLSRRIDDRFGPAPPVPTSDRIR